ncbi:MAG: IS66 family transposase, partial [Polaromonas sp.]
HASMIAVGCWVHLRRNFFELHASSKSTLALQALNSIGQLYGIEREIREQGLDIPGTTRVRQERAKPLLQALHAWLVAQRANITDNTPTAKAIDYATRRWTSMVRYADDGRLPLDNNRVHAVNGMNSVMPTPGLCRFNDAGRTALRRSASSRYANCRHIKVLQERQARGPAAYIWLEPSRFPWHVRVRVP